MKSLASSQGIPIEWTADFGADVLLAAEPRGKGTMLLALLGAAHLTWKKVPGSPTPMKRVEITLGQAWAKSAYECVV